MNIPAPYIPDMVGPSLEFFANLFGWLIIPATIVATLAVDRKKSAGAGLVCFALGLALLSSVFNSLFGVYGIYHWEHRAEVERWLNGEIHMGYDFNKACDYVFSSSIFLFLGYASMIVPAIFMFPKLLRKAKELNKQGMALAERLQSLPPVPQVSQKYGARSSRMRFGNN